MFGEGDVLRNSNYKKQSACGGPNKFHYHKTQP